MRLEIVTNVSQVADGLIRAAADTKDPLTFMAVCVIGGERHLCCDEAVVAYDGDTPIGIATIAPKGESRNDIAEIVGLFVLQKYRRTGVGRKLLVRAIERCRDRDLVPLKLNLLSRAASKLVKNLRQEMLDGVQITDRSDLSPF